MFGTWWERKWLYETRNPGKLYRDWEKENPKEKTFHEKEKCSQKILEEPKNDMKIGIEIAQEKNSL